MARVVMILAEGFEEAEAVIPADVLRRLNVEVIIAGLETQKVIGAHEIPLEADCLLSEVDSVDLDAVMLPGGMPGAENLRNSDAVMEIIKQVNSKGGLVCAICAAPMALARAGVLEGKKFTCYPGFEARCESGNYTAGRVEKDGNVITGKGPGAAFEYAAQVAEALGQDTGDLFQKMFVN